MASFLLVPPDGFHGSFKQHSGWVCSLKLLYCIVLYSCFYIGYGLFFQSKINIKYHRWPIVFICIMFQKVRGPNFLILFIWTTIFIVRIFVRYFYLCIYWNILKKLEDLFLIFCHMTHYLGDWCFLGYFFIIFFAIYSKS